MKLKKFLKYLNDIVKENPEALNYRVVFASDDDGNNFDFLQYTPSLGYYDEEEGFIPVDDFEEAGIEQTNVICIN